MMNTTGDTALFHGRRWPRMQNPLHYIGNLFAFGLAILLFTNNVWAGNTTNTLMLMGTLSPAMVGQGVTLSITVIGVNLAGSPSGSVTFKDGTATLGTVTLSNSAATLNTVFGTAGVHSITATYAGDTNYAASSTAMSITVYGHPTTSMLTVAPDPALAGQPVALKMTVTGTDPAAPPGGTVTFKDGTASLGTAALSNGTATLNTPFSTAGIHGVTATYAGDSNNGGTSMTTWFTAAAAASTIQLVPSVNPVQPGQSVSLTATVSGVNPTGTVTFRNGNTILGTALLVAGTASITQIFNTVGNYTLTASYSGDTNNQASASAPVTLAVSIEPQVYYIHADHLDTPRTITDTNGTVVWQWDNIDPFGANPPNGNPSRVGRFEFPLRFAGQYADKETNLYYNINRDYDPKIGAYIESDPIGLAGGINTYAYVDGNPIRWNDPLGLFHCTPGVDCNFTQPTQDALQCFDSCTGRDTAITGGRGNRSRPNSSPARGEACDVGRAANPDLSRESAQQCTVQCFSRGYGQEEQNRDGGTHFHLQLNTVPGANPGFSPTVRPYQP